MEINSSVWAFLAVMGAAILSYLSARNKNKNEGVSFLAEASVSLLKQYRLSSEEYKKRLADCKKELEKAKHK